MHDPRIPPRFPRLGVSLYLERMIIFYSKGTGKLTEYNIYF